MIRLRRVPLAHLNAWMVQQSVPSTNGTYRVRLWREDANQFGAVLTDLRAYIDEALEDARNRLRRGFVDLLSPFNDSALDPAANYPGVLNRVTLQGYLGETLAVLAVEHWGAHGSNEWCVPALLFRFHTVEFQHLDLINQRLRDGHAHDPDASEELRPGRTGDDGLAFVKDEHNRITAVLTLEAKCATRHRANTIQAVHSKLASTPQLPPGVRELIELLGDYDTEAASEWQEALLRLWHNGVRSIPKVAY